MSDPCYPCGGSPPNPCECSDTTPVREQGSPGGPGPAGATPTFTIGTVEVGAAPNVVLVPTGVNGYAFNFTLQGTSLLGSPNIWTGQNTFNGTTFLNGQVQIGTPSGPFPQYLTYGKIVAPNLGQFAQNAGEWMKGRLGIDGTSGEIKSFYGYAPNVVNNSSSFAAIVMSGATAATNIGPPMPIVLAGLADISIKATITFALLQTHDGGGLVTPILFDVYLDGIKVATSIVTDYRAFGEINMLVDQISAGAHSLQVKCQGFNVLAGGTISITDRTIDARW